MMNTDEEIYAVESGKDIVLEMSFSNRIYRMVFSVIGKGDNMTIYSKKKITYYNVENGITPKTRYDEKEFDNVSTLNGEIYNTLRAMRVNGYRIISPKKK